MLACLLPRVDGDGVAADMVAGGFPRDALCGVGMVWVKTHAAVSFSGFRPGVATPKHGPLTLEDASDPSPDAYSCRQQGTV
jgi:hypothetical protein